MNHLYKHVKPLAPSPKVSARWSKSGSGLSSPDWEGAEPPGTSAFRDYINQKPITLRGRFWVVQSCA